MSNPWIENTGSFGLFMYPVAGDVHIDVMHRDGAVHSNVLVGFSYAEDFSIDKDNPTGGDITHWRLHDAK